MFAGTRSDNMLDMVRKGRGNQPRGERVNTAKLTVRDVAKIRALYDRGVTQTAISKRFNVSQPAIGYIVRREHWKHL